MVHGTHAYLAEQAVEAAEILGARVSIPMHYGTFRLADDAQDEPLEELKRALLGRDKPIDFRVLEHGEAFEVASRP